MVPEDSKLTRCVRVLDALYQRGEMATRDVMNLLGVDRQTAMRDLRSLRDAGVPLSPVGHGAQRRYRLESAYRRTRMRITVGDVLALQYGRQLLAFLPSVRSPEWLAEVREKVAPGFAPDMADAVPALNRFVYVAEPHATEPSEAVVDAIVAALLQERELRVVVDAARRTPDPGGPAVYERLQPLSLALYRRQLWLLANDPAASCVRRIPLLAIREARRLDSAFRYPRRFDAREELARTFGVAADGEPQRIVLRFGPEVAPTMRRLRLHASQQQADLPDGGVEVRLFATGAELVPQILSFGGAVEVVEPAGLRAAVNDALEAAVGRYRTDLAAKG